MEGVVTSVLKRFPVDQIEAFLVFRRAFHDKLKEQPLEAPKSAGGAHV